MAGLQTIHRQTFQESQQHLNLNCPTGQQQSWHNPNYPAEHQRELLHWQPAPHKGRILLEHEQTDSIQQLSLHHPHFYGGASSSLSQYSGQQEAIDLSMSSQQLIHPRTTLPQLMPGHRQQTFEQHPLSSLIHRPPSSSSTRVHSPNTVIDQPQAGPYIPDDQDDQDLHG